MNGEFAETYQPPDVTERSSGAENMRHTELGVGGGAGGLGSGRGTTTGTAGYSLGELAYTRSGDKGNDANIGVVCRNPEHYGVLSEVSMLHVEVVQEFWSP